MKLKIFLRQTDTNNNLKDRPDWFNYESCFVNLLNTINWDICDLFVMFDGDVTNHFTNKYNNEFNFNIVRMNSGSETKSFHDTIRYICSMDFDDDDIIYIVENDYLHLDGWVDIIMSLYTEFSNVTYSTLYDHNDKYFMYDDLTSYILVNSRLHWRTVPSTTGTFFIPFRVLKEDSDIHMNVIGDHNKFTNELLDKGRVVLSSIPGYSTHCETKFLSPIINWGDVNGKWNI